MSLVGLGAAVPPAMAVTPFGMTLARETGLLGLLEIVCRALAAPVFADSTILLKKLLFLGFGDDKPPRRPDSPELFSMGCCVAWLEW